MILFGYKLSSTVTHLAGYSGASTLQLTSVKTELFIMEEKKAKMLEFIMGKGRQPTAERLKVQKELFGFNRVSLFIFIKLELF